MTTNHKGNETMGMLDLPQLLETIHANHIEVSLVGANPLFEENGFRLGGDILLAPGEKPDLDKAKRLSDLWGTRYPDLEAKRKAFEEALAVRVQPRWEFSGLALLGMIGFFYSRLSLSGFWALVTGVISTLVACGALLFVIVEFAIRWFERKSKVATARAAYMESLKTSLDEEQSGGLRVGTDGGLFTETFLFYLMTHVTERLRMAVEGKELPEIMDALDPGFASTYAAEIDKRCKARVAAGGWAEGNQKGRYLRLIPLGSEANKRAFGPSEREFKLPGVDVDAEDAGGTNKLSYLNVVLKAPIGPEHLARAVTYKEVHDSAPEAERLRRTPWPDSRQESLPGGNGRHRNGRPLYGRKNKVESETTEVSPDKQGEEVQA